MDSFHWTANFLTGHDTVDAQHAHLVGLVNRFGEQLAENTINAADNQTLLDELTAYAQYHFSEEEALMDSVGLDRRHIEEHKSEHAGFMVEAGILLADISATNTKAMNRLLEFLIHWLAYHILGSDKTMARQIAAIEQGASPAEAYQAHEHSLDSATEPLLVALNGLFQQVSERNRELVVLNQSLEAKVAARTRELQEANQHLEELALTDILTGLPNRRHAMRRLDSLWRESSTSGKPIACMMIDADHFKEVNDSHGHDAGDLVLKRLAKELKHSVRNDDVVCRLGGDEFFIICPNTDLDGALHIAELTRANVEAMRVRTGDGHWNSSISVGVAVRRPDMQTPDDLIKLADRSVYESKRAGKNCVRAIA